MTTPSSPKPNARPSDPPAVEPKTGRNAGGPKAGASPQKEAKKDGGTPVEPETGQSKTGQSKTDKSETDKSKTGQSKTGQSKAGQSEAGQSEAGQSKTTSGIRPDSLDPSAVSVPCPSPVVGRRVYSRRGDLGETALFSGPRVGKDQKRIVAVGALDELNSFLGLARSFGLTPKMDAELDGIQRKLFEVGTEIVAMTPARHDVKMIGPDDIRFLEGTIDRWNASLPPLSHFLIPGGPPPAAALHVARAVCRRAERRTVALVRSDETVSRRLIAWLNRLGDLLFVLARAAQSVSNR